MAIVLMVLGFMCWWPLGLLILGFLIARRIRLLASSHLRRGWTDA